MSSDEESEMDEFSNKLAGEAANASKKDVKSDSDDKNGSFGNFKCEKCLRKFARKYSLTRHHKNVPNCGATREYACRFCPEICANRDSLREHEMTHRRSSVTEAPQNPLSDSKCDEMGEEEEEEEEEEESGDSEDSEEEWPLKCLLCEKAFKSASDLRLHTVKAHNDDGVVADAFHSNRAKEAVLLRDTKDLEPKKITEKHKPAESLSSKKSAPPEPTKKLKEKEVSASSSSHSRPTNREKLKVPNRDSIGQPNSVSHVKRSKEGDIKTSSRESLGSANVSRKSKEDISRSASRHSPNPVKKFKPSDGKMPIRESKTSSGSSQIKRSKESGSSISYKSSKPSNSTHILKRPKESEGRTPHRTSNISMSSLSSKKHKEDSTRDSSRSSKTHSSSSLSKKSKPHDNRPSSRDTKAVHSSSSSSSKHKKSIENKSKTDKVDVREKTKNTTGLQSSSVATSNSLQTVHTISAPQTQQGIVPASGMNVYQPKNENVVVIRNVNPVNYSVPPHIITGIPAPNMSVSSVASNMAPVSSVAPNMVPVSSVTQNMVPVSSVTPNMVPVSSVTQNMLPVSSVARNMVPVSSVAPAMITSQVQYSHTGQSIQSGVNNTTVLPSLFNQVGVPSFQVAPSNTGQIVTHVESNQQIILNDLMHSAPVNVQQNPPSQNYYQPNDFNENVSLPAHIFSSDHLNLNQDHNQMNANAFTNVNSPNVYLNHSLPPPTYITPVQGDYAKPNPSHEVQMNAHPNYATVNTNQSYPVACNISMNEHVNLTQVGTYKRDDIPVQTEVATSINFAALDNNQQQSSSGILQGINCETSPLAGLDLGESSSSHLTGGTFSQAVTVLSGPTMGVPNQQQTNQFYHNNYYNPVQNVPISTSGYMNTTPVYVNDNSGFSHQSYTNTNFFPNQNNTGQLNLDELVAMTPSNINDQFTNQNIEYPAEPLVYTDLSNTGGPVPNNNDCDIPPEETLAMAENAGNPDNKPIPCLVCDKSFFTKSGLRHHTKRYHPDHVAALASVPPASTFKQPQKIESNEKPKEKGPLQCLFCEKTFFTKCGMKSHTVKHHAQEFTPKTMNQLTSKIKKPGNSQGPEGSFDPTNTNTSTPTELTQGNNDTNGGKTEVSAEEIKMCKIDGVTFIYCLFCEKPFSTRSGLRWHTAKHHGAEALDRTNNSLLNVRISHVPDGHVRKYRKSNEKSEKIEKVEKPVKPNSKFIKEADGFYKCSSCEKSYSTNHGLKEHFERHHSGKPFVRANASKSSKLAAALSQTLGEENIEASTSKDTCKAIQCMFCMKPFFTKSGLRYHIKRNHREHYRDDESMGIKTEGGFENTQMKVANAASEEVSLNQSSHKPISTNFIDNITMPCEICHQIFDDEDNFDVHIKSHLADKTETVSEKPVKCPYCDKIFPAKRSLVNHTIQKHREIFSKLNKKKAAIESNTQSDEGCKVKNDILRASLAGQVDTNSFRGESGTAPPSDKLPDGTIKTECVNVINADLISFIENATNESTIKNEFISDESTSKIVADNNQTPPGDNSKTINNEIFSCPICKSAYNKKTSLRNHMRVHIPPKCKICFKIFPNSLSLLRHSIIKHRKPSDVSEEYRTFTLENTSENLEIEELVEQENSASHLGQKRKPIPLDAHGNPLYVRCKYCHLHFETQYALRKHMKKHSGEAVVSCKFCGKECPGKISLLRHTVQYHKDLSERIGIGAKPNVGNEQSTPQQHKGPVQSFDKFANKVPVQSFDKFANKGPVQSFGKFADNNTPSAVKVHDDIKSESTERAGNFEQEQRLKSFTCKICNTVLENRQAWHMHVRKHFDELPSKCDDSSKQQRKKTLTCKICHAVLENRREWHLHVSKHFKDVPSKCHVCHRMFPKRLSLMRHIFQKHKNISRQSLNFKFLGEPEEVIKTEYEGNLQKEKVSKVRERSRLILKSRSTGSKPNQSNLIIKSEICFTKDTANNRKATRYGPGSCKLCNRHFATTKTLHKHMLEHVQNPKACKFCDRLFPNGRSLSRHAIQTHREEVMAIRRRDNIPDDRKYPMNWLRAVVEKHVKKEKSPVPIQDVDVNSENEASSCEVSVYSSTTSDSDQEPNSSAENILMKEKRKKKTSDTKYVCKVCNHAFYMRSFLIQHLIEHVKAPEVCPYCNKRYPSKKFLVRHKMKKHRSLATTSQTNLISQIKKAAVPEQRQYYRPPVYEWNCRMCTQSFNMKKDLEAHMREHYKEGPVSCRICNKVFQTGLSLFRHTIQMHKNVKSRMLTKPKNIPYRSADLPAQLRKEREILARSNPVEGETVCRLCKKKFDNTPELQKHWQNHKKRRPAKCDICDLIVCSRTSLRRHMLNVHKTDLPRIIPKSRKIAATKEVKRDIPKIPLVRILEKKDYIPINIWNSDDPKRPNFHQDFTNINIEELPLFDHKANDEYIRKMEEKMGLRDFFLDRIPLKEQNNIEINNKTNDEIKQDPDPDPDELKPETDEKENKENIEEETTSPELFEGHKMLKKNFNKIFATEKDEKVCPEDLDQFEHEFYEYYTDAEANQQNDLFSEFLISDETLKTNMDKFLKILLGEDVMRSFGWPEKSSDEVLSQIISKCGHVPATHDDDPCDNTTHIRENMTLFFKFVVDNNVAKKLMYSHTVDQILMRILKTAKEDELKIEETE